MILVLLLVLPLAREPETENTAYRYLRLIAAATTRLALTRGVINPNRGPGSVTRVITR